MKLAASKADTLVIGKNMELLNIATHLASVKKKFDTIIMAIPFEKPRMFCYQQSDQIP